MEQQWCEEGEEDEPKKKRKAVSWTRDVVGRVSLLKLFVDHFWFWQSQGLQISDWTWTTQAAVCAFSNV